MKKFNHVFVPMERDPRYCGVMSPSVSVGSTEHGTVSMRVECGYPPNMHIESESTDET